MTRRERRSAPRRPAFLLSSVRTSMQGKPWSGFARTLNLSQAGVLLETPDEFSVGQTLVLEFLLDEDRVVKVDGTVIRVTRYRGMRRVGVAFHQVTAKARRLLASQLRVG